MDSDAALRSSGDAEYDEVGVEISNATDSVVGVSESADGASGNESYNECGVSSSSGNVSGGAG